MKKIIPVIFEKIIELNKPFYHMRYLKKGVWTTLLKEEVSQHNLDRVLLDCGDILTVMEDSEHEYNVINKVK